MRREYPWERPLDDALPGPVPTNPPFGLHQTSPWPHGRTVVSELCFLKWWMTHAAPSGQCAIIVPDGVLFREARTFRETRERLLTDFAVVAVVRLPVGTFRDAPAVRTNILLLARDIQPATIRYYQVPRQGPSSSTDAALQSDALEGALAWALDGTPDSHSWEVSVRDIKQGNWSLDIPCPNSIGDGTRQTDTHVESNGQLTLPPATHKRSAADETTVLGHWIEKRGAGAGQLGCKGPFVGVYQRGLGPAKGKRATRTNRYRRVERNDIAYNPMRAMEGAIALCRKVTEEGWVSPDYIVFRVKEDAPFSATYVPHISRAKEVNGQSICLAMAHSAAASDTKILRKSEYLCHHAR